MKAITVLVYNMFNILKLKLTNYLLYVIRLIF